MDRELSYYLTCSLWIAISLRLYQRRHRRTALSECFESCTWSNLYIFRSKTLTGIRILIYFRFPDLLDDFYFHPSTRSASECYAPAYYSILSYYYLYRKLPQSFNWFKLLQSILKKEKKKRRKVRQSFCAIQFLFLLEISRTRYILFTGLFT